MLLEIKNIKINIHDFLLYFMLSHSLTMSISHCTFNTSINMFFIQVFLFIKHFVNPDEQT